MERYIQCIGRCFAVLVLLGLQASQCQHLEPSYPSITLCANSTFEVTCTSSTPVLRWTFVNSQENTSIDQLFNTFSANGSVATIDDLVFRLASKTPLRSTVTFEPIQLKHNGSILTCSNTILSNPKPQEFTNITILVRESPSVPLRPEFIPLSLDSAVLSWTSPTDSSCITGYTITLTNITEGNVSYLFNTTTNTTNMTVSDLTEGAEYSFTVAGIDGGGRFGEESVPSNTVIVDTPEPVIMLYYEQDYVDDSVARITLRWMPPPPSTRPPVIGYIVSYTSNQIILMNETSDMEFVVELRIPNTIGFTVSAVNVLGEGKGNNITISIVKQSASESTSMLGTPLDTQQNNLLYQVVIPCAVVLAILLVIGCILALVFHKRKTAVARKTASDLSCSENVAYDTVGNTVRMTTQENVSCSDNIAYANVNRQERIITSTSIGRAAYYEEVEFKE